MARCDNLHHQKTIKPGQQQYPGRLWCVNDAQLVLREENTHTLTPAHRAWTTAAGHGVLKFGHYHLNIVVEMTHQGVLANFCRPVLVSPSEL